MRFNAAYVTLVLSRVAPKQGAVSFGVLPIDSYRYDKVHKSVEPGH